MATLHITSSFNCCGRVSSTKHVLSFVTASFKTSVLTTSTCVLHRRRLLTLIPLTSTIVATPSNASKWQMGFNSAFKGLIDLLPVEYSVHVCVRVYKCIPWPRRYIDCRPAF
jgi:hypothetical protein